MVLSPKELEAPLSHLRALPFVENLRFLAVEKGPDSGDDGMIEVTTSQGQYRLSVQRKRSYLNQSLINAIIGRTPRLVQDRPPGTRRAKAAHPVAKIVLARYIPATLGEQLVNAGVSFADEPGNVHLRLGSEYNWTVLGKKEPPKLPEANRVTPATIQLLFLLATDPKAAAWTVRDLARTAGMSKTKVAQLRNQFLREGVLNGKSEFRVTPEISDRLVSGYSQILRPKLLLGRYRYPDSSADQFLGRLAEIAKTHKASYALTGGPAAEAMQRFYHGSEVPIFFDPQGSPMQRALRLLPDRSGPVLLLKPFGEVVYWREFDGRMVAPPWLVYAELLANGDPRAREAAEELRRGFLQ